MTTPIPAAEPPVAQPGSAPPIQQGRRLGSSVGRAPTEVGGRGFDSLPGPVPDCNWCGGSGIYIGGDEVHECFCVRDRVDHDVAAKERA